MSKNTSNSKSQESLPSLSRGSSHSNLLANKPNLIPGNDRNFGSSPVDINNPDPVVVDAVARQLNDNPNSLQTPGGDITRDLYRWTQENSTTNLSVGSHSSSHLDSPSHNNVNDENHTILHKTSTSFSMNNPNTRRKRSMSFSAVAGTSELLNNMILMPSSRTQSIDHGSINNGTNIDGNRLAPQLPSLTMTHEEIRAPGGFRRAYVLRRRRKKNLEDLPPNFITRNFIEFLTLYPHFAGEDLSESEEEEEEEEEEIQTGDLEEAIESETESTTLLPAAQTRAKERASTKHKTSTVKAVLLLLKSFVGTGVLFLPKAFHNGGWGFSSVCLLFCAILSYYCFVLLIITKDKVGVNGYGEMGAKLYGNKMKLCILQSIALSQIGFAAAYAVFTATNLKVFFENVMNWDVDTVSLGVYIWLQALIFIPLALTRNIARLSGTALIADLFILLGLVYVYYYSAYYVITNGVASSTMVVFNKSHWSLFIGTAIFTFEGIGLLIPIQESMKNPQHFQASLSGVMIIVTIIFISSGLICYSAFGSHVETVVLLNFPQDTYYTALVQLLYALAILLSTPLQMFPAIRILEHWTFPSSLSGKYNPRVKWLKNYFRTFVVLGTTAIAWVGANDLDKFVSLVGSLACIPLIYIHPPLLHFKAAQQGNSPPVSKCVLLLDLVICVFGVGIMAYTSWQTISLWILP
ncbi:neutral amino acid transporter [Monosporozyma unispora]|nr:neutral amino acid transporter [Kazachstania unispora]